MIYAYLTEAQQIAVGARLIWKRLANPRSEREFAKWMARACIKLQTYF